MDANERESEEQIAKLNRRKPKLPSSLILLGGENKRRIFDRESGESSESEKTALVDSIFLLHLFCAFWC